MKGILLKDKNNINLILLITSTWFLGTMAVQFASPLMPVVAEQFQVSQTLVKYMISVFLFGKAFGMLAFGPLSEKYGRRKCMLIGLLLFSAGNLLAVAAPGIKVLLLARLLQGFGVSATVLMGRVMINDVHKANKAAIMFSHVFFVAAIIITFLPIIGSFIVSNYSWRLSFVVMGLYSFGLFALAFFFLPETLHQGNSLALDFRKIKMYYKTIISHPVFLGYVMCSICMIAGESAFNTASSFLLIKTYGLSVERFGMIMTSLGVGHLVGTKICGTLLKKYDLVGMMGVGVVILAASALFMVTCVYFGYANAYTISIPMIIFYVGTGFVMTITAVGAVVPFPQLIGIASSASLLLNFSFSALSSAIMSHLSTKTAAPVSTLVAICGISSFLLWLFLIIPNRNKKLQVSDVSG